MKPLFSLGHVAATPGALAALEKSGQQPDEFLARHVSGEWGEIPPGRHQGKPIQFEAQLPALERLPH